MQKIKTSEHNKRENLGVSKYKPEFCNKVIEHLRNRKSLMSFGGTIDVVEDTIYHWRKVHPEFDEAVRIGQLKGMARHEEDGVENIDNKNYNAILWQMIGRRLYKFSEQRAVKVEGLDKCKNYEDEISVVMKHVAEGKITPQEGSQFAQLIATKANTYEKTEAKKLLEEIKISMQKGKYKK